MIILTISARAANLVGAVSTRAIATLHQAQYSVIRQEGLYGFTGSLTVPLERPTGAAVPVMDERNKSKALPPALFLRSLRTD